MRDYMLSLNKNKQPLPRWGCGGEISDVDSYVRGGTAFVREWVGNSYVGWHW